jgi:hypothetical protein
MHATIVDNHHTPATLCNMSTKTSSKTMTLVEPWFLVYQPSEKYEFVSWDDDIPNNMESHQIPWFQTTNQMLFIVEKCRTM